MVELVAPTLLVVCDDRAVDVCLLVLLRFHFGSQVKLISSYSSSITFFTSLMERFGVFFYIFKYCTCVQAIHRVF